MYKSNNGRTKKIPAASERHIFNTCPLLQVSIEGKK